MSDKLDFPRLVYKKTDRANAEPIWGLGNFDILTVNDGDEHAAALADGWMPSPDSEPAKPKADKKAPPAETPAEG